MVTEEIELIGEPCYIESRNVSKNITRLISLMIDKHNGVPVDDQIDGEITELTANNLRMKRCMIRQVITK